MKFQRTFSAAPWEAEVGYCRALRAGAHIYVTGTAPVDDAGGVFAPGDGYGQAGRCLALIERALHDLGAARAHIVRTRMFVTDISRWPSTAGRIASSSATSPPRRQWSKSKH